MTLPIDLVGSTSPPRFVWRQIVATPVGPRVVEHVATLPPSVEAAVVSLINLAKQQAREIEELRRQLALAERAEKRLTGKDGALEVIAAQSAKISSLKKGKG